MSQEAGHLYGGAAIYMRYPIRVSIVTAGIPILSITDEVGVSPPTTTQAQDVVGLGLDTATYSTTQADLDDPASDANIGAYGTYSGLDMGKVVTVSVRPDLIIRSLMSGGPTAGTVLPTMSNTSASAGGTTVTATNVNDGDLESGTVWCIGGANVGHARQIVTDTASTSLVVTVPFPRAIAVGDRFLECPYSGFGTFATSIDGFGAVQLTTLFDQADAEIASGTGCEAMVFKLELNGAADSRVLWMFRDHQWNRHTVPA